MKYLVLDVHILVWTPNKKKVWLLNKKSVEDTAKRRDTTVSAVINTVDLGADMSAYISPEIMEKIS